MRIGILGINHKSADLSLREQLARACQKRFNPENSLHGAFTCVLLSTCNRTEIYFSSEDLAYTHTSLLGILRHEIKEEFEHRIYSYFGSDCFFHLARVTAGMDSAIIGETEIQGQVKQAYEMAASFRPLSKELHFLFQKSLKIGKEVRSKARFEKVTPSLGEAIWNAGKSIFADFHRKKVLFIGISEINHLIFQYFKRVGFEDITFCNRTAEKTFQLAAKEEIRCLEWRNLNKCTDYDLVIFGTKSPHFLLTDMPHYFFSKKLIVDLSVPRNVDPHLAKIPNLTLLNIDQLNLVMERKKEQKDLTVDKIEKQIIAKSICSQLEIFKLKELKNMQRLLFVS